MSGMDVRNGIFWAGGIRVVGGVTSAEVMAVGAAVAKEVTDRKAAVGGSGVITLVDVAGTANAITANMPADDWAVGVAVSATSTLEIIPAGNNTGAVTLKIGTGNVEPVRDSNGTNLVANDLVAGRSYLLKRRGNGWRILNDVSKAELSASTQRIDAVEMKANANAREVSELAINSGGVVGEDSGVSKLEVFGHIYTDDFSVAAYDGTQAANTQGIALMPVENGGRLERFQCFSRIATQATLRVWRWSENQNKYVLRRKTQFALKVGVNDVDLVPYGTYASFGDLFSVSTSAAAIPMGNGTGIANLGNLSGYLELPDADAISVDSKVSAAHGNTRITTGSQVYARQWRITLRTYPNKRPVNRFKDDVPPVVEINWQMLGHMNFGIGEGDQVSDPPRDVPGVMGYRNVAGPAFAQTELVPFNQTQLVADQGAGPQTALAEALSSFLARMNMPIETLLNTIVLSSSLVNSGTSASLNGLAGNMAANSRYNGLLPHFYSRGRDILRIYPINAAERSGATGEASTLTYYQNAINAMGTGEEASADTYNKGNPAHTVKGLALLVQYCAFENLMNGGVAKAVLRAFDANKEKCLFCNPVYHYPFATDRVLTVAGQTRYGRDMAATILEYLVYGVRRSPLRMISARAVGPKVYVQTNAEFDLALDNTIVPAQIGAGFRMVRGAAQVPPTSVTVSGKEIILTMGGDILPSDTVKYGAQIIDYANAIVFGGNIRENNPDALSMSGYAAQRWLCVEDSIPLQSLLYDQVKMTQAQYDEITPVANTIYFLTE